MLCVPCAKGMSTTVRRLCYYGCMQVHDIFWLRMSSERSSHHGKLSYLTEKEDGHKWHCLEATCGSIGGQRLKTEARCAGNGTSWCLRKRWVGEGKCWRTWCKKSTRSRATRAPNINARERMRNKPLNTRMGTDWEILYKTRTSESLSQILEKKKDGRQKDTHEFKTSANGGHGR